MDVNTIKEASELPSVRELIADDYAAGLVLTRIGTGETFDFEPPVGADVHDDWTAYGAARDWFRTVFTNGWGFAFGTNTVDALTVFSYGTARPRMKNKDAFISPLESSLGLVPAANWDLLDFGPSQFWQLLTPSNTLVMTWRNGLLNRDVNSPVSFQMECWPEGQVQFRYDLSRLSDSIVSNLVVGIRNEGAGRVFTQLVRGTTSLAWGRVTMDDLENPDRDGDGLATVDELMIWHTDPDFRDSDGDGLSDGEEVALGTNPLVRDFDGDGFVDGSDPEPLLSTSLADLDEDTLPDAYENHWFGGTNVVDTASSFGPDGFSYAFDLDAGINPTNAPEVVFSPTNQIAAWKLTDAFGAQTSQRGLVFERTLPISRHGSWEQFFVSSRPDRAGDWRLEGLSLEWEDSEGVTGVADRSPRGDSLYLPVSTNGPARLTIRLRADAAAVSCRKPLYLLAYSPSVSFDGGVSVETSNAIWRVVTIKEETRLPLAIDQTGRPCKAPLYSQELTASYPARTDAMGIEVGGEVVIPSPGVYELPHINLADYREATRRLRKARNKEEPDDTAKNYLACLNPKLTYGTGHHYNGNGLAYFADENRYEETYAYPLDSSCLWRSWHSDATGGYVCSCEPKLSVGFDISGFPDITTNVTVAADVATGTISIGGTEVWRDTATHDVTSSRGGGIELLSGDECDECPSCAEGNCDSLEGPELGSLKFRIPLGVPRKDQVSGFAWLRTEGPVSVGLQTLQLLARSDAQITDTRTGSVRVIACRDNRGRTLTVSPIDDGIEIVTTETGSGKLEHTWRITNESRSASRVRLQKISRLNNLMSDTTFVYVNGEWTEFDNISESSEQLISEDSLSTDGVKREERIVRHPDGQVLSHAITELTRIGSFADAVLRETYHAEKGWGDNWKESFASYYEDCTHPKRHGNVRLVWGNDRPWKFSAYDGEGRPVLTLEQHDGSACPTNELAWIGADFHGYDVFGNRIAVTNALGSVTSTSFDADSRPSAVSGATYSLRQGYDAEGRRTNLSTTRDGQVWDETHWTYDAATGLCTVKRYADDSTVAYTHTQDGKPLRTTFPSGRWSENEYNVKRERTAVRFSDGGTDTFVYDEFSQEISYSNAVAAVVLLRADNGAITNELWRIGTEERTHERAYDPFGRLSANDGAVYSYAEDGRLATIATADATVSYSYAVDREDAGYVLTLANGVSFVRTVTRDPYRRSLVTGISNRANGVGIESLDYTYDALNRPILRNADSFGYNTRSEVTSATVGGHSSSYGYDEVGNSVSYAANSLNQYTAFGYDADGNLLTDNALDFTYDAANRLKTVSSNGVLLVTNDYDAKSRRVRKTTPEATTTYFYDDWNLVEERIAYMSGATSTIRYQWGKDLSGTLQGAGGVGGLLYLTIDGNVYAPFYDNNGNVTHYCDASGAVVAAYTYDAFGNTLAQSGALADLFRHRFSTKYYDAESGLYYYGYRFYHPTLMRWLNRDPLEEEGGLDLYAFCKNNSVSNVDPLGNKVQLQIERRMNEVYIPRDGNGSGRGRTVIDISGLYVYCKGCRLFINGRYSKIMYILRPDDPAWSMRLTQYDSKWGKSRSNQVERNATIAHENDHWVVWNPVEQYIAELNKREGEFLFFCGTRAAKMQKKLYELIKKARDSTHTFDQNGMNQGGMAK